MNGKRSKGKSGISIGRSRHNAIVIDSPSVSNVHAQLVRHADGWHIEDLGSRNGTAINDKGRKVRSSRLSSTDMVYLGGVPVRAAELVAKAERALGGGGGQGGPPGSKAYVIGRSRSAAVRLDYKQISREHARLIRTPDQRWMIEDMQSRQGTFLRNRRHPVLGPTPVKPGDVVYLGSYKISASRLIDKALSGSRDGAENVTISQGGRGDVVIGRDPRAGINLPYPQISWQHAKVVQVGDDRWIIEDLGSRNGTFVNGKRVKRREVTSKDNISLGFHQITLAAGNVVQARDLRGDIRLDAENISLVVGKAGHRHTLLDKVGFSVFPSEFVGMMGLSGAGKTTLLLSLLGYRQPTMGNSQLNGIDLYTHYDQFKSVIGYVPQDDILHGELNVKEALVYAARLRLPPDTSASELDARIDSILRQLGLIDPEKGVDVRNLPINPSGRRGISGGQRKRVNLAMELLSEPSILFLDEPTSGLSSVDALVVMRILRRFADQGKTIIMTLHQPDIESYRTLDNILVLDKGKLTYYGPAWPDSLTFFNPDKPAEDVMYRAESGLMGLSQRKTEYWQAAYASSPQKKLYVDERLRSDEIPKPTKKRKERKISKSLFSFRQWLILTKRNFVLKLKDRINTSILLMQAPIIALLLASVFYGQENVSTPLFMLVISGLWLGTANAAREIVSEQSVYLRERMIGLGIPEYLLSKFSVLASLSVLQCLVLTGVTKLFVDIRTGFPELFALLLLVTLTGVGLGLFISSLAKSPAAAQALIPLAILPMVFLGGGIVPLPDMVAGPAWTITQAMPSRWGYEALIQQESPLWRDQEVQAVQAQYVAALNQYKNMCENIRLTERPFGPQGPEISVSPSSEFCAGKARENVYRPQPVPVSGVMLHKLFMDDATDEWLPCGVLGGYLFLFLIATAITIKMKDPL